MDAPHKFPYFFFGRPWTLRCRLCWTWPPGLEGVRGRDAAWRQLFHPRQGRNYDFYQQVTAGILQGRKVELAFPASSRDGRGFWMHCGLTW